METPREDDFITNDDESKRLPEENPEPLEGIKKEEHDIQETGQNSEEEKGSSNTE